MEKKRLLSLGVAWVSAFALVLVIALTFQVRGADSQGPGESELEADKALAAEQSSPEVGEIVMYPNNSGGDHPLFAGVDDVAIPAVRIDVTNNNTINAFSGVQVWGAAYSPDNNTVYFNSGTTLLQWPVGGTATSLGTMVNSAGAAQSLVALAYYDGVLYGTKNIAPEAVHIINPVTLIVTPTITYPTTHDMGGFSIDPDTGTMYATDDGTTDLVIINSNGTVTSVAQYPAGVTDIDGLAVGGGRAYLVTDDANGNIYVYNLGTNSYEPNLTAPWPTSETFSAGAWIEQAVAQPEIALSKTVGTDAGSCATTSSISVPQNTDVTYCYEVTNTGDFTLTVHDLSDSELGAILTGFPYTLAPGASAFLTQTTTIITDTTNVATWTACNIDGAPSLTCFNQAAYDVVSDTATASVTILPPSIAITKTVGTDPSTCATTTDISVPSGTDVTYCYEITNTGEVTLTVHDLSDSELGAILTGFPYTLAPGASAFLTQTTTIITDTTNVATWTACNIDGAPSLTCFNQAAYDVVSDTATASVTILLPGEPNIVLTKTVGLDNSTCASGSVLAVGQPSTEVYYCYTVMNTGGVTFTTHDLDDDMLGSILSGFPFVLGPGQSTSVFPVTETITTSVTNVATWTAYFDNGAFVTASASATVTEGPTAVSLNSFTGGSAITLPVMLGVLALMVFAAFFIIRRVQGDAPLE